MKSKIDEIIENFDFVKVNKVMTNLDWKWYNEGVPTVGSLVLRAQELLNRVCEDDIGFIGTGGFEVSKDGEFLSLKFVIEEWSTGYE